MHGHTIVFVSHVRNNTYSFITMGDDALIGVDLQNNVLHLSSNQIFNFLIFYLLETLIKKSSFWWVVARTLLQQVYLVDIQRISLSGMKFCLQESHCGWIDLLDPPRTYKENSTYPQYNMRTWKKRGLGALFIQEICKKMKSSAYKKKLWKLHQNVCPIKYLNN